MSRGDAGGGEDAGEPLPISGGEGGVDVYVPPPPPNCDITKLPKEDPCVVDESAGVFVSSSLGADSNAGSRAKPLKTLKSALDVARISGRRVYACAETFNESVELQNGVAVFGFFDCAQAWKIVAKRASASSAASPAATAKDITKPTRVEGFEVLAPDAAPGASSVGLLAINAAYLQLVDVRVRAGKGGDGADAPNAAQLTDSGSAKNGGPTGVAFACNVSSFACIGGPQPGAGGTNVCMGKNVSGGPGGGGGKPGLEMSEQQGFWTWVSKQSPTHGGAQPASAQTAQGGVLFVSPPAAGASGAFGSAGVNGGELGAFDSGKLYAPSNGTDGTDGTPGQGGGGAVGSWGTRPGDPTTYAGYRVWGNAGGGGGAGGCPGLGGTAGKGGGASVAILAFQSPMQITSSTLETSTGGAGGKGGFGSAGTLGGAGGSGTFPGAPGGPGGNGGYGGNGGGGPSIAIVSTGAAPITTMTQLMPGQGGAGVAPRASGNVTIPASPAGKSATTHTF